MGAWRFEQSCLVTLGRLALIEGHRGEAIDLLQQAVALSKELGRSFHGAHILGALATALEETEAKRRALSEAEALIAAGCPGHNQLRFYPDAINVALELGDLDEVERYAEALEDFTKSEPLAWADFFIARGRALVAHARGQADPALACELQRLRDEGLRMGFIVALPAIEAPLTDSGTPSHGVLVARSAGARRVCYESGESLVEPFLKPELGPASADHRGSPFSNSIRRGVYRRHTTAQLFDLVFLWSPQTYFIKTVEVRP